MLELLDLLLLALSGFFIEATSLPPWVWTGEALANSMLGFGWSLEGTSRDLRSRSTTRAATNTVQYVEGTLSKRDWDQGWCVEQEDAGRAALLVYCRAFYHCASQAQIA